MEVQQSLLEHLEELRKRLIRSLLAISVMACVAFVYSDQIFNFVRAPIAPFLKNGLIFTAPSDKFMAYLKVSFFAGVLLSCPIWIYQIWRFVAPALYAKEKKYVLGFVISGSVLFLTGVLFSYYLALPAAFDFLLNFGSQVDTPMITIEEYLSFFLVMSIMFGLCFELPLVIVVLGILGIVSQKFLRSKRRFIIVGLAVLAAVATPSADILSMLLLLVPLVVLFEVAVLLVGFFERKQLEQQQENLAL